MEHNELDLSQLRQCIDQLDHEIARLMTERMEISGKVAAYKKANNLPIYHPEREKQVIEKVCALTKAEYREALAIFQYINISKAPLRVCVPLSLTIHGRYCQTILLHLIL